MPGVQGRDRVSARRELRRVRRRSYRLGSILGDVDAFTSGDPRRIIRRLFNKTWGRRVIRKAWWK